MVVEDVNALPVALKLSEIYQIEFSIIFEVKDITFENTIIKIKGEMK